MRGTRTWAKMFRYCQIKLNGSVVAQGEGRRAQGAGRRAQKQPALSWFRLISADFDKLNNQLNHRTKGTTACPELVEGNKNQQTTNNEQRTTIYTSVITSNPMYACNALGMQMPSSVWLFSSNAATIRGKASALPLRVCASCVRPSLVL